MLSYKRKLLKMRNDTRQFRIKEIVKILKSKIEKEISSSYKKDINLLYNDCFDYPGYGSSYAEVKLAVEKIASEGISIYIDEDDDCDIKVSI